MGEKGTIGYNVMKRGLLPKGPHPATAPWKWENEPDPDHAFNPDTGQNTHWDDEKQQWIDSKTGEPVGPSGLTPLK
jgi:hypothetical protein